LLDGSLDPGTSDRLVRAQGGVEVGSVAEVPGEDHGILERETSDLTGRSRDRMGGIATDRRAVPMPDRYEGKS